MLNDPEEFVRAFGIRDRGVFDYLRALGAVARLEVKARVEVTQKARELLQELRGIPGAESWAEDVAGWSAREEARALESLASSLARTHVDLEAAEIGGALAPTREERDRLKARALRRLKALFRYPDRLGAIRKRLRVCRLCDRFFVPPAANRAQKFCEVCRRRWSPQQLWYRAKHKGQAVRERQVLAKKRRR